jgi:hypothetical protein
MNKSLLPLILGLCLLAFESQAQKLSGGLKAGLNVARWSGDAVSSFTDAFESSGAITQESLPGFHAGGYLSLPLGKNVSLEPGLYYSQKGTRLSQRVVNSDFLKVNAELTNYSHYIDLPLLLNVELGSGFQLYGGPQLSYLLKNEVDMNAGIFGVSMGRTFDYDPGLRSLDFGLSAGAGYEFANGLRLGAGYDYGLSSLDAGRKNVDAYNRVIKVSMGYRFGK